MFHQNVQAGLPSEMCNAAFISVCYLLNQLDEYYLLIKREAFQEGSSMSPAIYIVKPSIWTSWPAPSHHYWVFLEHHIAPSHLSNHSVSTSYTLFGKINTKAICLGRISESVRNRDQIQKLYIISSCVKTKPRFCLCHILDVGFCLCQLLLESIFYFENLIYHMK